MATIITVHGTFAHRQSVVASSVGEPESGLDWWQAGSEFERQMREALDVGDDELAWLPFVWSGDNSELERRKAGLELLGVMKSLEERAEPYCVVGHSHGGSVIASALLYAAWERSPLSHLRKWLTVGTPFLQMKPQPFLARFSLARNFVTRLTGVQKSVFLLSFLFSLMGFFFLLSVFSNGAPTYQQLVRVAIAVSFTLLPMASLWIFVSWRKQRIHRGFSRATAEAASQSFGKKWLGLWHPADEAIMGLKVLPRINLTFVGKSFAHSLLDTVLLLFFLPLAMGAVILSPSAMVWLADTLKAQVYFSPNPNIDLQASESIRMIRSLQREVRAVRLMIGDTKTERSQLPELNARLKKKQNELTRLRLQTRAAFPNLLVIQRAQRFDRRFFQREGRSCQNNRLCGGGADFYVNVQLIYHLLTDGVVDLVSEKLVDENRWTRYWVPVLPILIPSLALFLFSVAFVYVATWIAAGLSTVFSKSVNKSAAAGVRRSAYGNDTENEFTFAVDAHPNWIGDHFATGVPEDIETKITTLANCSASASIERMRNAVGAFAYLESYRDPSGLVSQYLTWKELIHTNYFEVPECNKLIAAVVSECDGFDASPSLRGDPYFHSAGAWLKQMRRHESATSSSADASVMDATA